jgi:predicted phage terminase large subunit-like protein
VPIFPEKFSIETLTNIRDAPDMGEYMFSCQYMNNPRNPELQDFNVQDLRFWRWSSDESHVVTYKPNGEVHEITEVSLLDVTVSVDLAPAEKITSDRNAVIVSATTPAGDVIILDAWAARCTPLELMDHLFKCKQRYNPRVFGIESVAYQKAFKYFLKAEADRRGVYLNIVELKATGKKEVRIRGLQPVAATGHLYIPPHAHELRNEFSDFPLGKHDDLLDALAMQLQLWRGVVSAQRWARIKAAEERMIRDIDGYGLRSDRYRTGQLPPSGKVHPRDIPHPDDLGIEPPQAPIHSVVFH